MSRSTTLSERISPEYLAEQRRLHAEPRGYGGRGDKWADVVEGLIAAHSAKSVLDYGCGQGKLGQELRWRSDVSERCEIQNYDPAVLRFSDMPGPNYDLVVCTDVLEHVEPGKIGAVLAHLRDLTQVRLFTVISLVETAKTLSDGRQAHILLKPIPWWVEMMIASGLLPDSSDFPNPKPHKQFVSTWRPA